MCQRDPRCTVGHHRLASAPCRYDGRGSYYRSSSLALVLIVVLVLLYLWHRGIIHF